MKIKKKVKNPYAKRKLKHINAVQKLVKDYVLAGELSDPRNTMLFFKSKESIKTKLIQEAFENVRFQWTVLIGILCRHNINSQLYTRQIQIVTDKNDTVKLNELNDFIKKNLFKIHSLCNPQHILTGFYVAVPKDTDIDLTYVSKLFFKYKTPDSIGTSYELDNSIEPQLYCDSTWIDLHFKISFEDIHNYEPEPLIFTR